MSGVKGEPLKGSDAYPVSKEVGDTPSSQPTPPLSDDGVQVREKRKDGYGSTEDHIFSDPSIADYWRKVYEFAKYENRHRYDPSFSWTAEEEKKLVRKVSASPCEVAGPAIVS